MNYEEIRKIFNSIKEVDNCPICNNLINDNVCINNDHYLSFNFFTFIHNKYEYFCEFNFIDFHIEKSAHETYDVYNLENKFEEYINIEIKDIEAKSYKELYDFIYKIVKNSIFL